ncbi:MAG: carboxypeptidase-like regulatory domain-containing protein [Acidobacteria bacterium]|nr:carboxypeptidase-like regulatory domain-containing protein [Acidobacteriota bacterium]
MCILFAAAGRAQTGEVRGFITAAQANEPLPSVQVGLASSEMSGNGPAINRHARSGLDGRFRFTDVSLGGYSLSFRKDGYEAGSSLSASAKLSEAEPRADLRVEMRRSAAISGRVLDAAGDPVPLATVQLYERLTAQGLSRLQYKRGQPTNDLGEYRLSDLEPGRYFAAVLPLSLSSPRGVRAFEFPNVYYPNAGSIEESAPIAVNWGVEREGVDFHLPRAMRTSLEGAVFHDESGQPCPACNVTVLGPGNITVAAVGPDEQGLFTIRGLHPGEYRLLTQAGGGGLHAEESVLLVSRKTVEVALAVSATQDVAGHIVADTAPPEDDPEALTRAMRVRLASEVGAPSGRLVRQPILAEGGGFRFSGVTPGSHHVFVEALPRTAYVLQMLLGGRPLKSRQVSVPRGAPLEGLEIRISFDGGVVQGSVGDEGLSDSATGRGFVVLLPDRYGEGWHFERLGNYRPEDGAYEITGVPPGSYTVFAIGRDNHFDPGIAGDLGYLRERGRPVRVTAGEAVTVKAPFVADRE